MTSHVDNPPQSTPPALRAPGAYGAFHARALFQALKLVLAALLAYAIWRAYQNPDLMLDLGSLRIC